MLDWRAINRNCSDEDCRALAQARGYSFDFVSGLRDAGELGVYMGCPAFPVRTLGGRVEGWHYKEQSGKWKYFPSGLEVMAFVFGDFREATTVWVFESQWDAFAVMYLYGWRPTTWYPDILIFITRGSGNGALVKMLPPQINRIVAFRQNDLPQPNGKPTAADRWLHSIVANAKCPVFEVAPPKQIKDVNEWTQKGASVYDLTAAVEAARHLREGQEKEVASGESFIAVPEEQRLPTLVLPSHAVSLTECAEQLFTKVAGEEVLFLRGTKIMELGYDDDGALQLQVVSAHGFRSRIEQFFTCFAWRSGANGEAVLKPTVPAVDTCKGLMESVAVSQLPRIRGVINCPLLLRVDESRCQIITKGYDRASGLLVSGGDEPPSVPLEEAVGSIEGLLADFDFQTPGDFSRAIASILTPALKLGGHISGSVPVDVAEADQSQAGKSFRGKMIVRIYREDISLVTQKQGGVGSDDETFNAMLVRGRPFIQFDNRRGRYDSAHLEAFLTATGTFPARVPHAGVVYVDPSAFIIFLTSNGVETTPDLANRSSIIRIRKRPRDYTFKQYPEGDVLDFIKVNQPYLLGCVFSVLKEWIEKGCPKTNEHRHNMRDWCQSLDWIVREIFKQAPLMSDHDRAQQRVSNPALSFARRIAIVADKCGLLGRSLAAQDINDLAIENGVEIPSCRHVGDASAFKIIGQHFGRLFREAEGDILEVEDYIIKRSESFELRTDGQGTFRKKVYTIGRVQLDRTIQQPPQQPQ